MVLTQLSTIHYPLVFHAACAAAFPTSGSVRHAIGSTLPTSTTHANPPNAATAAQIANPALKFPVRSTIHPVSGPTTTPARLLRLVCSPVHFPATEAPAKVWAR